MNTLGEYKEYQMEKEKFMYFATPPPPLFSSLPLTVGELKALLADLPDDIPVNVWSGVGGEVYTGIKVIGLWAAPTDELEEGEGSFTIMVGMGPDDGDIVKEGEKEGVYDSAIPPTLSPYADALLSPKPPLKQLDDENGENGEKQKQIEEFLKDIKGETRMPSELAQMMQQHKIEYDAFFNKDQKIHFIKKENKDQGYWTKYWK